jgi:hypothetical protein
MQARSRFTIPHGLSWAAGAIVLAGTLLALGLVQAQPPAPARAGVVIRFGDGSLTQACVELGDDGQATGEEALLAVGLPVILEAGAVGAAVCKVGGEGCDFPATSCFCQCSLGAGASCRYWAYNRLVNGQWQLSNIGASSAIVRAGDVQGWAWGDGTVSSGALPPQTTFNEVCAAAVIPTSTDTAQPTPMPSAAAEPSASAQPPAVYVPLVGQPAPATPTATLAPTAPATASAAPPPPAAAGPTATPAARPAAPATDVPTALIAPAAPTSPPVVTFSPTASVGPSMEAISAAATPTTAASAPPAAQERSVSATSEGTAAAPATASPSAERQPTAPRASTTQGATHTPGAATPTMRAAIALAAPTAAGRADAATKARADAAPPVSYLALGALVIALAVGWRIVRARRRA